MTVALPDDAQRGDPIAVALNASPIIERARHETGARVRQCGRVPRSGGWAVAWAAALLLTCAAVAAAAGVPAVRRTQEARVLVAAREMLVDGGSVRAWLLPRVNGRLRLQKPPLCYWMTAGAFRLFGVNEWAGRLPSVLAGLGSVSVTFAFARRQYGARVAWLAAAILAGGQLHCRLSMLAETDAPAAFCVTLAVWALSRGLEHGAKRGMWFHLASVAMAGAAMSKGPPVAFPFLVLLGWCIALRSGAPLWRWVRSGAPLTFIALAAPWWAYVYAAVGSTVMRSEVRDLASGRDHGGTPLVYLPMLAVACAPWSAVTAVAVWQAGARWRRDARLRPLLIWALAVLVPLCFLGNKQPHYLLPLLAPLAILTAWFVDRVLRLSDRRGGRLGLVVCKATLLAAPFFVAAGIPAITWAVHRSMNVWAALLSVTALVGGIALLWLTGTGAMQRDDPASPGRRVHRWSVAAAVFCALSLPAMVIACQCWAPSLEVSDSRSIAWAIEQRFPGRPLCFSGDGAYLPVCFSLRRIVPFYRSADELEHAAAGRRGLVVLVQNPNDRQQQSSASLPRPFHRVAEFGRGAEQIDAYVIDSTGRHP